jgi:hypothetical protein
VLPNVHDVIGNVDNRTCPVLVINVLDAIIGM